MSKRMVLFLLLIMIYSLVGCEENDSTSQTILDSNLEKLEAEKKELIQQRDQLQLENEDLRKLNEELKKEIEGLKEEIENVKPENSQRDEAGLINLIDIDPTLIIDLKYATEDNFTHEKVYPVEIALLQKETARKLKQANEIAKKDGYSIKVWDAYRPLDVQKVFWELVPNHQYVADPSKGSNHNRGTAVDVTLVDSSGKELEMPSEFDDFTEKASRNYERSSMEAKRNMEYLTAIMKESGFTVINSEWWHFNDINGNNYPLLNIPLD